MTNHYAPNGSMTCWAFLYLRTSAYGVQKHSGAALRRFVRIFQKNLNGGKTDESPNQEPSAEEILLAKEQKERMVLMLQCLQEALATLTPMQKRRLEARFAAAMKYREIADEENVSMTSITTTVRNAVLKLRDYFIKHGWLESPKEATVCTRVAPRKRIRKKTRRNRS